MIYIYANLFRLFLIFVFVNSIFQMEKQEERSYSDFGDSLQFLVTVVPVFLACQIYSLIWGIKAILEILRRRDYQAAVVCGCVTAAWLGMIEIMRLTH